MVNGTTGEGQALSVPERKTNLEAWFKACKITKQHLMVQVGGCPLPDVLDLAKHAESIGVDSLLSLPELYFKPTTPQELINYLKVVAQAAPKTPLLYYHSPKMTGVKINMEQFLSHPSIGEIPTLVGIKYAGYDLDEANEAYKANNGKYTVFLANTRLLAPWFALGFDSASLTSLSVVPQYSIQILDAVKNLKLEEARKIQATLTAVCNVIIKEATLVPAFKAAMNILTPIDVGLPRAPQQNLTKAQVEAMEIGLKKYL